MPGYTELDERLARTEERVEHEAGLRAAQDEELAELKVNLTATGNANKIMLQAVGDTQSEHTETLARIDGSLTILRADVTLLKSTTSRINGNLLILEEDVTLMKGDMAHVKEDMISVKKGQQKLEEKLDAIEGKLDLRLEAVESKLNLKLGAVESKLNSRLGAVESKLNSRLDAVEGKLNSRLDAVESKIDGGLQELGQMLTAVLERVSLPPSAS